MFHSIIFGGDSSGRTAAQPGRRVSARSRSRPVLVNATLRMIFFRRNSRTAEHRTAEFRRREGRKWSQPSTFGGHDSIFRGSSGTCPNRQQAQCQWRQAQVPWRSRTRWEFPPRLPRPVGWRAACRWRPLANPSLRYSRRGGYCSLPVTQWSCSGGLSAFRALRKCMLTAWPKP